MPLRRPMSGKPGGQAVERANPDKSNALKAILGIGGGPASSPPRQSSAYSRARKDKGGAERRHGSSSQRLSGGTQPSRLESFFDGPRDPPSPESSVRRAYRAPGRNSAGREPNEAGSNNGHRSSPPTLSSSPARSWASAGTSSRSAAMEKTAPSPAERPGRYGGGGVRGEDGVITKSIAETRGSAGAGVAEATQSHRVSYRCRIPSRNAQPSERLSPTNLFLEEVARPKEDLAAAKGKTKSNPSLCQKVRLRSSDRRAL